MTELPEWLKEAGLVRGGESASKNEDALGAQAIYLTGGKGKPDWRMVIERRGGDLYIVTDMELEQARKLGFGGG